MNYWRSLVNESDPEIPIFVVQAQCDRENELVLQNVAVVEEYCANNSLRHVRTSALDHAGIDDLIDTALDLGVTNYLLHHLSDQI